MTKEVMKELRREEEQGKEMQVELPAWEEVDKLKKLEKKLKKKKTPERAGTPRRG